MNGRRVPQEQSSRNIYERVVGGVRKGIHNHIADRTELPKKG